MNGSVAVGRSGSSGGSSSGAASTAITTIDPSGFMAAQPVSFDCLKTDNYNNNCNNNNQNIRVDVFIRIPSASFTDRNYNA